MAHKARNTDALLNRRMDAGVYVVNINGGCVWWSSSKMKASMVSESVSIAVDAFKLYNWLVTVIVYMHSEGNTYNN